MTSEAKKEKDILEITKGENANLAGMEPRCPKCGSKNVAIYSSSVKKCYIECKNPECEFDLAPETVADFAQFFRSPAPTPPLDVARDAARYWRLRVLGCAPMESKQLDNGTVLRFSNLDEFVDQDIKAHPSRGEEEIGRHIASPAPQLKLKIQELVGLPVDREIEDDLVFRAVKALHHAVGLCQHSHWGASPAQPEKRDEWVSVENGPPREGLEVSILISDESVAIEGWPTNGYRVNGEWWCGVPGHYVSCSRENWTVTHWQPLPAPPQSGKEGQ